MLKSDTCAKTGAARHTGDITRRYESPITGGYTAEPHPDRTEDDRRRLKIKRMKSKMQDTPKIG
jgi:hypothetical protein